MPSANIVAICLVPIVLTSLPSINIITDGISNATVNIASSDYVKFQIDTPSGQINKLPDMGS